jgi:acyl carrier protein
VFTVKTKIRQIIENHGLLHVPVNSIEDSSDLYNAGMTSHSTVVLMLALENGFGIEFPATHLNRTVFESVDSIAFAIDALCSQEAC